MRSTIRSTAREPERMEVFDEHELRYLRSELLLRMGIQNLVLIGLIPLFAGFVALSVSLPSSDGWLAVAYVVCTSMGALYWIHSAARTVQIKTYLRTFDERFGGGAGWESWLAGHRLHGIAGARWFISTKAVFVGSQIAAVVLTELARGVGGFHPAAFAACLLAIAATVVILRQPRMSGS